jgi:hypothetical protein
MKDEFRYLFYDENGILIFSTNNKQKARKFVAEHLVEFVRGDIVKHPTLSSFWTGVILYFKVIVSSKEFEKLKSWKPEEVFKKLGGKKWKE